MEVTQKANASQKHIKVPKYEEILVVDKLLTRGWTSYLAICVELNNIDRTYALGLSGNEYYSELKKSYLYEVARQCMLHLSRIYTLVHFGKEDDSKKELFIEEQTVNRKNYKELGLCDSDIDYLFIGRGVRNFKVFKYKAGYSILQDIGIYNSVKNYNAKDINLSLPNNIQEDHSKQATITENTTAIHMYREELKKSVLETHKIYGDVVDPELMDIKKRSLALKNSLNNLIHEVTDKIEKRKKEIEDIKKDKPFDWIAKISKIYSNAIEMGRDIINEKDIAPVYLDFGAHLLGYRDCSKAESILNDAITIFKKESIFEDGNAGNSRGLALGLELLAYLHTNSNLEKYELAEKEAKEGIEIFRKIMQDDIRYKGDIAFLLKTLAGIHIHLNKFEQVEHEYLEAISIFSQLSDTVLGEYDRMLAECYSELGHYYASRGRNMESISAYRRALPFWEQYYRGCEDRYNKANAIVYLVDIFHNFGDIQRCEALLLENICNYQDFNTNSSNAFNYELSELYLKLGNLYTSIEDFEKANEYLGKAEVVKRELACNNPILYDIDLARTLIEQAILLNAISDKVELSKLQEALSLLKAHNDEQKVGLCYYWMGFFCFIRDNYDDALPYLGNAERSYRRLSSKEIGAKLTDGILAMILKLQGDIYSDQTFKGYNPELAEQSYKEALDVECHLNRNFGRINDGRLTEIYVFYGCLLCNEGRLLEAEPLLECGLKLYEQNAISTIDINLLREVIKEVKDGIRSSIPNQNNTLEDDEITNKFVDSEPCLNSIQDEINSIKISDYESKEKCYNLYQKAIDHCVITGNNSFLADVYSSYCQLLANDCNFQKMIGYASQALNIYDEMLRDNNDYSVWNKYIEVLLQYCQGLSACGNHNEIKQIIDNVVDILPEHPKSPKNKTENLFVALKNKLYLRYVIEEPSNEALKLSEQMVSCFRDSGINDSAHYISILLTAAKTAGENEKWSKMLCYLLDANKIVQKWVLDKPEERLAAGRLYALFGVYHQIAPGKFSQEEILKGYEKSRKIYEEGIALYPELFKSKLLNLYSMQINIPYAFNSSGINDVIHDMYKIMGELSESNPFVFNHQCVDIQLEIESLYQNEYLSSFDVNVEADNELLSQRYNHSMSSYDEMESLLLIYGKSASELYNEYMKKIDKARENLTTNYMDVIKNN